MGRAQKLEAATAGPWSGEATTSAEEVTPETPRDAAQPAANVASAPRGVKLVLAIQVVMIAAIAASAVVTRELMIDLRRTNAQQAEAQATQLSALAAQTSELQTQTSELQTEVSALRQLVASRTGEDVIFLKIMVLKPRIDPELARQIARAVHQYSALYRRDPDLALAIMTVESDFNPKAVSSAGATGLMQVMPHWKKVLGIQGDLKDPEVSVQYGLQVLGFYLEMYKDVELALTAYNRGPGPVDNALVRGSSPNNGYAPRVLEVYEKLKRLNATPSEVAASGTSL